MKSIVHASMLLDIPKEDSLFIGWLVRGVASLAGSQQWVH